MSALEEAGGRWGGGRRWLSSQNNPLFYGCQGLWEVMRQREALRGTGPDVVDRLDLRHLRGETPTRASSGSSLSFPWTVCLSGMR